MNSAEFDQLQRSMDTKLTMVTMAMLCCVLPSLLCINWIFNYFIRSLVKQVKQLRENKRNWSKVKQLPYSKYYITVLMCCVLEENYVVGE